ncbi:MAG: hypothetical protein MI802_00625 [Desulfobacterales bacterium]|nr:hypothetical protein [Desulfobacterales bacterium]
MGKTTDTVRVIDQTIREGMQYQGLVFSLEQRLKILEYQARLGVDVCQAGYPSAHPLEAKMVEQLAARAENRGWPIRVAALGRMWMPDVRIMLDTGVRDFHFHIHLKDGSADSLRKMADELKDISAFIKKVQPKAVISLAVLDMGSPPADTFKDHITFLDNIIGLDILSLPDTSGIMIPSQVDEKIKMARQLAATTEISIHCHNDMGMAAANTIAGVMAGAGIIEATALGIGERNGIADLFTTATLLKGQGKHLNLNTDDNDLALEYYYYVDGIVKAQTGHSLLTPNFPIFGLACATHVAGTHADAGFGNTSEERFFLNPLCGKRLVEKYMTKYNISYNKRDVDQITAEIKTESFSLGRRLTVDEVRHIARNKQEAGHD